MIKRTKSEFKKKTIFDDLTKDNILLSLKIFSVGMIYLFIIVFKFMWWFSQVCMKLCVLFAKSYDNYGKERKLRKSYKKQKKRMKKHGKNRN